MVPVHCFLGLIQFFFAFHSVRYFATFKDLYHNMLVFRIWGFFDAHLWLHFYNLIFMHIRHSLAFCFSMCKKHKEKWVSWVILSRYNLVWTLDVIGQFGFVIWESNSHVSPGDEKIFHTLPSVAVWEANRYQKETLIAELARHINGYAVGNGICSLMNEDQLCTCSKVNLQKKATKT